MRDFFGSSECVVWLGNFGPAGVPVDCQLIKEIINYGC